MSKRQRNVTERIMYAIRIVVIVEILISVFLFCIIRLVKLGPELIAYEQYNIPISVDEIVVAVIYLVVAAILFYRFACIIKEIHKFLKPRKRRKA